MENKIHLSDNGYDFLVHYLTELYGERGKAKHNITRYLWSDEFGSKCKVPNIIGAVIIGGVIIIIVAKKKK